MIEASGKPLRAEVRVWWQANPDPAQVTCTGPKYEVGEQVFLDTCKDTDYFWFADSDISVYVDDSTYTNYQYNGRGCQEENFIRKTNYTVGICKIDEGPYSYGSMTTLVYAEDLVEPNEQVLPDDETVPESKVSIAKSVEEVPRSMLPVI